MIPQKPQGRKIISDVVSARRTGVSKPGVDVRHQPQLQSEPRVVKSRRIHFRFIPSRTFIVLGVVLVVLGGLGYLYTIHAMTLVITTRKSKFNLESGVLIKMSAKEFKSAISKKEEGKSRTSQKFAQKAGGIITAYNNFNSASQILLAGTRFRSSAGLIYRSKSRVAIPGKSGDKPGAVDVAVVADEVGEKYNTALTDFVIPGFAGSAKYEKFYGRSKTEIKGGAAGQGNIVGKVEAEELWARLESAVREEVLRNVSSSFGADMKEFPDHAEYTTVLRATDPAVGSPAGTFFGEVRGEARTLAVERAVFVDALARALFGEQFRAGSYRIVEDSGLTLKNIDFDYNQKTVTLRATGTIVFEWIFDENALRRDASTASKVDMLKSIMANYPGITEIKPIFIPAFLRRIPRDASRIHIEMAR